MKIRQKMLIMELSTAAAFIIALLLFFVLLHNIMALKNIEIQSQNVLNKLHYMKYRSSKLVNSRYDFIEQSENWEKSLLSFTNTLEKWRDNKDIRLLGNDLTEKIQEISKKWERINFYQFSPFKDRINDVIERNLKSKVGNYTLSYAIESSNIFTIMDVTDYGYLGEFLHSQKGIAFEINNFTELMELLIDELNNKIEIRIMTAYIIVAIIIGLSIIGALIAAFRYGRGLSSQVKEIEKTAREVTRGNFDVRLDISNSDEFINLSENFNAFTDMLWSRLDAVRTIMKDMTEISGEMEDIKRVEEEILKIAMKNSNADAGAVFLYDSEENILIPSYVKGQFPPLYPVPASLTKNPEKAFDFFTKTNILPGENIIGKVASSGKATFVKDPEKVQDFPKRWSNDPLHISSCMVIPLLVSNNVLGVFALVKTKPFEYFTDLNFTNMKTFGEYTALSIDNRYKYLELKEKFELSRELSIASEIQKKLLLKKIPQILNLQISSYHNTAKGISGDYFDIFKISKNKTAIIMCDVAGKGIPAALIMVMIRTVVRVTAHTDHDAGTLLTSLNKNISGKVGADQYATMGIVIIDQNTGELTFSNASHLPLNIYSKENKRFREYLTEGIPIGVEKNTVYNQQAIKLKAGDIATLCTDGVTEARNKNGIEFSTDTLLQGIKKHSEKNAEEITEIIGNEMSLFLRGSDLYDDQSLLIMKYKG